MSRRSTRPCGRRSGSRAQYAREVINNPDVIAAHRELVEASNGVRHLLVVEDLTAEMIEAARTRLSQAYERVTAIDDEILCV